MSTVAGATPLNQGGGGSGARTPRPRADAMEGQGFGAGIDPSLNNRPEVLVVEMVAASLLFGSESLQMGRHLK